MALDESTQKDTVVEEEGIRFFFDQKTATLVGELVVDYDEADGFTIYDESVPRSDC